MHSSPGKALVSQMRLSGVNSASRLPTVGYRANEHKKLNHSSSLVKEKLEAKKTDAPKQITTLRGAMYYNGMNKIRFY